MPTETPAAQSAAHVTIVSVYVADLCGRCFQGRSFALPKSVAAISSFDEATGVLTVCAHEVKGCLDYSLRADRLRWLTECERAAFAAITSIVVAS